MKRTIIYILFSVSIVAGFIALVLKLDTDTVRDLEYKFNQQQFVQVDLAKRSLEEQFNWQINNIVRMTKDLSVLVEYHYFYDTSGQRLLYSARSINQISMDLLEARLSEMVTTSSQSNVLSWAIVGDTMPIIVSTDPINPQNELYEQQLITWYQAHQSAINESTAPYVTEIYASPTDQFVGIFHPITNNVGEHQGLMGAVVDLRPLITQFIEPIRSGQYGAAWLQDFNGKVIFDHESEIIGQNVFDLHANYPALIELDKRYPNEESGTAEYSFTVQRGGDINRKLMAWNTAMLGNRGLTVALSAPDTEISALLSGSRQTSLFFGVLLSISLVGSGGVFYYLQQTDLRRLVKERTQELENEQYHLQLEIADRRRAEAALRDSETNFRQMAENIRETFFVFDLHTNETLYISPAFQSIWKCSPERFKASPMRVFATIYDADKPIVREQLRAFKAKPDAVSIEFRIVNCDGELLWLRWRAFPVVRDGQVHRVICTAEDITLQKQAHEAEISIEIERKRTQLLANFVQAAFHEFRTPLSIINTSVFLLGQMSKDARSQEYMQHIREESSNIMNLVEQLVMMSKLDVDELNIDYRIHIDTMMQDLEIMMQPEIQSAQLTSTWDFNANSKYVMGDAEQLHLAIKNILDNAIKYSDGGTEITVQTYADDRYIYIDIGDTGDGIEPTHLEHIFERFYRADKAHSTRGFGLGLPITQRIIEQHHGAIQVESTHGVGTKFHIILPIATTEQTMSIEPVIS